MHPNLKATLATEWLLTAVFFWNRFNDNPNKITKSDQMWFRGFVSIILNPFLRVFAISAILKVIHVPKTPKRGGISGTPKITFPHIYFQILAIGTSHKLYKHPHVKGFLTKYWKSWKKIFQKFFKNFFFSIFKKIFKIFFSRFSLLS